MNTLETAKSILLITVDDTLRSSLGDNLVLQGFRLLLAKSPSEALAILDRENVNVVFLDIDRLRMQEMDMVHYIRMRSANTEIIVLATINELEDARNALRNGASFYLIKPVAFADIRVVLDQMVARADRNRAHIELEHQVLDDLMAGNAAMEKVLKLALKIAPTSSTVLIGGESGTGKEFFARIIHRMSDRADGRFVPMNCGAVPDTLFESELFGHRKGSFTGAARDKPGLVEEANFGTLFLDEVGELTPPAQVKLLRFLQERTFRRIGETTQRTVNVRIIAASNRDLRTLMQEGRFREDLFYRLNVIFFNLPPLRERRETIPTLIKLFVHRYNTILDKRVNAISKPAELMLANYNYPGNVRELENIIEHAMVLTDGSTIGEKALPEFMHRQHLMLGGPEAAAASTAVDDGSIMRLDALEKHHIERALMACDFAYSDAARKLGISRSTLWRKIKTYKIRTPRDEGGDAPPARKAVP